MTGVYYPYSDYLRNKYKRKVYKLTIHLPLSCPNRDGAIGYGGCSFCGEKGAGFEGQPGSFSVSEQLEETMRRIKQKYKAEAFIAYFQNYSNTYMPLPQFTEMVNEALIPDIAEIAIATRPDCINDLYLQFLLELSKKNNVGISIELGLQSTNIHTLRKINRGHGLAEYIDAVTRIKKFGFDICTHVILNLPWDTDEDCVEAAKILSVLGTNHVKLHALYIVKGTEMARQYEEKEIEIISADDYKRRVIKFLQYLSPDIAVQRLIGRVSEGDALFANWKSSWWKIRDEIVWEMEEKKMYQGMMCNYTNGSALKKWL